MRFHGFLAAALLMTTMACAMHPPVIGGTTSSTTPGTISGSVTTTDKMSPLAGRRVTAIETTTGRRYDTSTSSTGGYTMQVPRGVYRLEVELRTGEKVAKQPAETEVNRSDLDAQRDFQITR